MEEEEKRLFLGADAPPARAAEQHSKD